MKKIFFTESQSLIRPRSGKKTKLIKRKGRIYVVQVNKTIKTLSYGFE